MVGSYNNVEVLMATYNGAKYVGRQIDSILMQKNVNVHITIRDDGSTDNTIDIIRKYEIDYPTKVTVITGKNIGHRRCFLTLLSLASKADFYAFSDQDDIWQEDKLYKAIEVIGDKKTVLYTSNLDIVDSQLNVLGKTNFSTTNSSIYSEFTRHRYAGCTFVFDQCLMDIVLRFSSLNLPNDIMPGHDALICRCAYACGVVLLDENTYINHIRYSTSVTAGGNGIIKRIKTEWKNLTSRSITSQTAILILNTIPEYIKQENECILKQIATYKNSVGSWIKLLLNRRLKSGILICDLMCKLKILLRTY